MPLVADNILEARSAYAALEVRAQFAEQNAALFKTTIDNLSLQTQTLAGQNAAAHDYAAGQAATNSQLVADQAGQVSPDITFEGFVAALGLAVALAEATMPGRTINQVQASVQSYLALTEGPGGATEVGLRLYQPELGAPTALATTTFELAKVAPAAGAPTPRSLYAVLEDLQAAYSDPFWIAFTDGSPPTAPAQALVAQVSALMGDVDAWKMPYLLTQAAAVAGLETRLAALAGASVGAARAAVLASTATALAAVAGMSRQTFTAGDLYALTAALDATAAAARLLVP
jgi:hypothetical protein